MTPKEFRAELVKIMPGFKWTVHKSSNDDYMEATGTKSSGFNRLSTLRIVRAERNNGIAWYEAKSSGFGLRAPWLATNEDATLARALRGLQRHYEERAATYAGHARALQSARAGKTSADIDALSSSSTGSTKPRKKGREAVPA